MKTYTTSQFSSFKLKYSLGGVLYIVVCTGHWRRRYTDTYIEPFKGYIEKLKEEEQSTLRKNVSPFVY